jgi:hypothetical protein
LLLSNWWVLVDPAFIERAHAIGMEPAGGGRRLGQRRPV